MNRALSLLLRTLVVSAVVAGQAHAQAMPAAVPDDSTQPAFVAVLRDSTQPAHARKSPVGAATLGLVVAGSGHWYAGERGRGTLVALVYLAGALTVQGGRTDQVRLIGGTVQLGALGFSIIDGARAARRFNRRQVAAGAPGGAPAAAP
jgi:hypothetical protein